LSTYLAGLHRGLAQQLPRHIQAAKCERVAHDVAENHPAAVREDKLATAGVGALGVSAALGAVVPAGTSKGIVG